MATGFRRDVRPSTSPFFTVWPGRVGHAAPGQAPATMAATFTRGIKGSMTTAPAQFKARGDEPASTGKVRRPIWWAGLGRKTLPSGRRGRCRWRRAGHPVVGLRRRYRRSQQRLSRMRNRSTGAFHAAPPRRALRAAKRRTQ